MPAGVEGVGALRQPAQLGSGDDHHPRGAGLRLELDDLESGRPVPPPPRPAAAARPVRGRPLAVNVSRPVIRRAGARNSRPGASGNPRTSRRTSADPCRAPATRPGARAGPAARRDLPAPAATHALDGVAQRPGKAKAPQGPVPGPVESETQHQGIPGLRELVLPVAGPDGAAQTLQLDRTRRTSRAGLPDGNNGVAAAGVGVGLVREKRAPDGVGLHLHERSCRTSPSRAAAPASSSSNWKLIPPTPPRIRRLPSSGGAVTRGVPPESAGVASAIRSPGWLPDSVTFWACRSTAAAASSSPSRLRRRDAACRDTLAR